MMATRMTIGFVALMVVAPTIGAQSFPTGGGASCSVSTIPYALLDGAEQYKRLDALRRLRGIKSWLDALYSVGVSRQINESLASQMSRANELLKWSGAKGVLLDVTMQVDLAYKFPPKLLSTSILGFGGCPYDVLVDNVGKPTIFPGPSEGYRIDPTSSFFVWGVAEGGTIKLSPMPPGSRGPLMESALADKSTREFLKANKQFSEHQRLLAIAQEARKRAGTEEAKTAIDDAAKTIRETQEKRTSIEAELKEAIAEQNRIAGATAWLTSLEKVVAVAQLGIQVNAMLAPNAPPSVKSAIEKAASPEDLKNAVAIYAQDNRSKVEYQDGQYKLIVERYNSISAVLVKRAKEEGAPDQVIP
jgi:hypothetical protein